MANPIDMDEIHVLGLKMEQEGEGGDSIDLYISRPFTKEAKNIQPLATVRFTGNGTEFSLVAVPYATLETIARSILKAIKDYRKQDTEAGR